MKMIVYVEPGEGKVCVKLEVYEVKKMEIEAEDGVINVFARKRVDEK